MEEQWKTITEFSNYEVSNKGNVRHKECYIKCGKRTLKVKQHYLKPETNERGYRRVQLRQDGRIKRLYVHRLVAEAFIPNHDNKPQVNHIDSNPSNNCIYNLEWCTPKENSEHMVSQGRNIRNKEWIENQRKGLEKYFAPVIATNIETGEQIYFERLNGVIDKGFQPSCVSNCCKGKRQTHKGYIWRYA